MLCVYSFGKGTLNHSASLANLPFPSHFRGRPPIWFFLSTMLSGILANDQGVHKMQYNHALLDRPVVVEALELYGR